MSDTSGTGGYGPSLRGIREGIRSSYGPSRRATRSAAARATPGKGEESDAKGNRDARTLVWAKLAADGTLEDVLVPQELEYYVRALAEFIDTAKTEGLAGVTSKYGLEEDANFPSFRRLTARKAPGNQDSKKVGSEHHSKAGGAFAAGTTEWVKEMTRVGDPTQVSIRTLVEAIRVHDAYDRALVVGARAIITQYGERVIQAVVPTNEWMTETAVKDLTGDFENDIDAFMSEHPAEDWGSGKVAHTLKQLPKFVRNEK